MGARGNTGNFVKALERAEVKDGARRMSLAADFVNESKRIEIGEANRLLVQFDLDH